jgi:uncharacterized protein YprB with RNaseH-like and TPR domain
MQSCVEAFLDIETTGLSPAHCQITVVGIHLHNGTEGSLIQLVGDDVTADNLLEALEGTGMIYSYNGSRFDLPFIRSRLGIDLAERFPHRDLMHDCWRRDLYGGLKCVERKLGIQRQLKGVDGFEAVRLWWRYVNDYDEAALATLLEYNKEDVVNLKSLKEKVA